MGVVCCGEAERAAYQGPYPKQTGLKIAHFLWAPAVDIGADSSGVKERLNSPKNSQETNCEHPILKGGHVA